MSKAVRRTVRLAVSAAVLALAVVGLIEHFTIRHFRVVDPAGLYRSGQPQGMDWARLAHKYRLRTVVNLRADDDPGDGADLREEEQAAARYGMRLVELPIKNGDVPTTRQADQFLRLARDRSNWPMLVHCARGKDRTGAMILLYRVCVQGWPFEAAAAEMEEIHGGGHHKPEAAEHERLRRLLNAVNDPASHSAADRTAATAPSPIQQDNP